MKTIKITAKFATVLEALEASDMDISYNPQLAKHEAAQLEVNNRHFDSPKEAFLCEDGKIRFVIACRDGLNVLNTFSPFSSCLDNAPFTLALIKEDEIQIHENLKFPKSMRKMVATLSPFVVA